MVCLAAFTVLFLSRLATSEFADCLILRDDCNRDPVCRPLQTDYLEDCSSEWTNPKVACRQSCISSYFKLLGNVIGRQYYKCDCGSSALAALCQSSTDNLLGNCFGGVFPTPPPLGYTAPIDPPALCSSVTAACGSNPTCTVRLVAYQSACEQAFFGFNCSQQCNATFYDLLRHPVGSGFYGCSCGNDTSCDTSSTNLYRTCFNGSLLAPPPTDATPTMFPVGTCEAFNEKCFYNNYGTCGSLFTFVFAQCNQSIGQQTNPTTCPTLCSDELNTLIKSIPYATELLGCNCSNSSSPMCNGMMSYQRLFSLCGVTAPSQYPPNSCEGLSELCIRHLGAQCGSSQQRVFEGDCGYFTNAQGAINLSLPCSNDCQSSLQGLATSASESTVLTCFCADSTSTVCQHVMSRRTIFNHCGVTAAPPVDTTTAITTGQPAGGAAVVANVLLIVMSVVTGRVLL